MKPRDFTLVLISLAVLAAAAMAGPNTGQVKTPTPSPKPKPEVQALLKAGDSSNLKPADKLAKYQRALDLATQLKDLAGQAGAIHRIGLAYFDLGQIGKADQQFESEVPIRQSLGDLKGEGDAWMAIGLTRHAVGDSAKALDAYSHALSLERKVGDLRGEGATLNNLANVYFNSGDWEKAPTYIEQSISIARQLGNKADEASSLSNEGVIYHGIGKLAQALTAFEGAQAIRSQLGDRGGVAWALNNLGSVYSDLGQKDRALESYQQALPALRQVADRHGEATTLSNIGSVYIDLGQIQKSVDYFNEALVMQKSFGDRNGEAGTLSNLASAYGALGSKTRAVNYFSEALAIEREIGDREGEALALENLGETYAKTNELDKAVDLLRRSSELTKALTSDLPKLLPSRRARLVARKAAADANLGDVLVREGKATEAEPYYLEASQLDPRYATNGKASPTNTVAVKDEALQTSLGPTRGPLAPGAARGVALNSNTATGATIPTGLSFRTGKRYALIVGTDTYASPKYSHLNNAASDATALATALRNDFGFEPILLVNKRKAEVLAALSDLAKKDYGPADELLVFFAGHGDYDDKLQHDGMIVCTDTAADDTYYSSYIADSFLRNVLDGLQVKHVLLVLDVCFGGAFDKHFVEEGGGAPRGTEHADSDAEAALKRNVGLTARWLITSGGEDEEVSDGKPGGHSPFVSKLLDILGQDVPYLTFQDLLGPLSHIKGQQPLDDTFGHGQLSARFVFVRQ